MRAIRLVRCSAPIIAAIRGLPGPTALTNTRAPVDSRNTPAIAGVNPPAEEAAVRTRAPTASSNAARTASGRSSHFGRTAKDGDTRVTLRTASLPLPRNYRAAISWRGGGPVLRYSAVGSTELRLGPNPAATRFS